MHGVRREKLDAAKQAARQKELCAKRDHFLEREKRDFSEESLAAITQLLELNVENCTAWNYRKEVILSLFPMNDEDIFESKVKDELAFSASCIRRNTKVYWIWFHRKWLIETCVLGKNEAELRPVILSTDSSKVILENELSLCERLLQLDGRNFHCWNYRRWIATYASTVENELAFTERMIDRSFGNYSAWHNRTWLLSKAKKSLLPSEWDKRIEEEFDYCHNALFTGPEEQSAWLYFRWLCSQVTKHTSLEKEKEAVDTLLSLLERPSKWALQTRIFLCRRLDKEPADDDLDVLCQMDPDRSCFYRKS